MIGGAIMTEDLVLMERLESRENKGPIKVTACANLGAILCLTVGVVSASKDRDCGPGAGQCRFGRKLIRGKGEADSGLQ